MQKSSTTYLAIGLVVVAVVAFVINLSDKPAEEAKDQPGVSTRQSPAESARDGGGGSNSTADVPPLVELSPLEIPDEEAPAFETFDLNDDGSAEIDPFISVYGQIQTPIAKVDMLGYARAVEPLDSPKFNKFLIQTAAFDEDPVIRSAARDAMLDYSSKNGHASLEAFLNEEPEDIQDETDLKELLEDLSLPSYKTLLDR